MSDDEEATPGTDIPRRIPPRPDGLPPEPRTAGAFWSGIVATAIAVPAFVDSFSWSIDGPDPDASGWPITLWYVSFFLGLASMILARRARNRERLRRSHSGQKLAGWAVRVDIVGTCIWGVPFVVMVGSGL